MQSGQVRHESGQSSTVCVEAIAACVKPCASIQGFRAGLEGDFPQTTVLITKEGCQHLIREACVLVKPRRQVFDKLGAGFNVSLCNPCGQSPQPLACRIVFLSMPADGAVSGCPHQALLMSKMLHDGGSQMDREQGEIRRRIGPSDGLFYSGERLENLLVFIIDFRDKHRV